MMVEPCFTFPDIVCVQDNWEWKLTAFLSNTIEITRNREKFSLVEAEHTLLEHPGYAILSQAAILSQEASSAHFECQNIF